MRWGNCTSKEATGEATFNVPETLVDHFAMVPSRFQHKGVFWWRLAQVRLLLGLHSEGKERVRLLLGLHSEGKERVPGGLNAETRAELDLDQGKERVPGELNAETRYELDLDQVARSIDFPILGLHVARSINFTHPILGLHVRRGDSCHTTLRRGRCVSLSTHLARVEAMVARYNVSKVFLATDDPSALEELRRRAPHLTFISLQSFDRSNLQSGDQVWLEHRLERGEVDAHQLMLFTLRDLLLLAQTDFMVGHLASNLSRLTLLLASARAGPVPFASVDGPWCYHWRMCCQLSLSPSSFYSKVC
ncbi:hypothetical protein T484DRAFT_1913376 [Baffinella frigidus]|nr:hypothetical protein T484DRAFT_1913376 [Cryptophyta sp. CCMP2293]